MDGTTSDGRGIIAVLLRLNHWPNGRSTESESSSSSAALTFRKLFITCPISELVKHATRHLTSGVACGRTIKSLISCARGVVVIRDASRDGFCIAF
jgi:hypothetical protein